MKQETTVHLCMSLEFPMGANGKRDYLQPRAWVPEVWAFQMDNAEDRIYIGTQTVSVEVPEDFNPVPAQVAALEAEKAKALAKYQQSVAQINERLSKLLAITNEATPNEEADYYDELNRGYEQDLI
jgi:hypothetical protein